MCTNIRRIRKGRFSQPVHDLIFEKRRLIREDFVENFSTSFFKTDGQQYFQMKLKNENGKTENLINLGPSHNF